MMDPFSPGQGIRKARAIEGEGESEQNSARNIDSVVQGDCKRLWEPLSQTSCFSEDR